MCELNKNFEPDSNTANWATSKKQEIKCIID